MDAIASPRRWYRLAPDRLVLLLLVAEVTLWLSDRVGLPEWHNGYAVLSAIAVIGAAFVAMLLWFVATLIFQWRFQFSLRALLVLVIVVAVPCSWFALEMKKEREQREVVAAIGQEGAFVVYGPLESPCDPDGSPLFDLCSDVVLVGVDSDFLLPDEWENAQHFGNDKLRSVARLVARLHDVQVLDLHNTGISDSGLQCLDGLSQLRTLSLENTQVTDAGLEHLRGLVRLKELKLYNTKVTDGGVKKLRQELPNCEIER